MSPELQLLQKTDLPGGKWFVVNPVADWQSAGLLNDAAMFSDQWAVARQWPACEFSVLPNVPEGTERVLLFLPKAKPRFWQLLKQLQSQLGDAELWVVGENSGGIKSATKPLVEYFSEVGKVANAKRCGLLRCAAPIVMNEEVAEFAVKEQEWLSYHEWSLAMLPGLFNKGQVDKGTELLLAHLPQNLYGNVLDMGCGGGVLSLAALAKGADNVLAVDSSAVALKAAGLTFEHNGTDKASVLASDVFSDVPRDIGGSFDWVISNPPFHTGVGTDYQPAQRLIEGSKRYVKSGGRLMFVANRHLPYEQWLEATFKRWELLDQQHGFKVLVAYQ